MKELPYFRFSPMEYINADISFCPLEIQGLFIRICCFYWTRNCRNVSLDLLYQKFNESNNEIMIKELINKRIIKVDDKGLVHIDFLNEQYRELAELHRLRVAAGEKGGRESAKQRSSNA